MEPISIVQKSAEAHGTLGSWQKMKSLSFTKRTELFNEDGSAKKLIIQHQKFDFEKGMSTIESVLDSAVYHLKDGQITIQRRDSSYVLNGEELTSKQSMFSSALYVISQPFQLLESNATFTREDDTFIGDKKAFAIRVHYKGDTPDSDQWTYYFDQNSFRVLACEVRHGERVSKIENTSYDSSTPFLFNATRTSTIMENGKPKFVIAKYEYSNYQVELQ